MVDQTENPVALGGANRAGVSIIPVGNEDHNSAGHKAHNAHQAFNHKLLGMRSQHIAFDVTPEFMTLIRKNQLKMSKIEPFCGHLSVCLCRAIETSTGHYIFEFDANGVPAVVFEAICFRRENGNINPYTADLVAWPMIEPCAFATALGQGRGCELLGAWFAIRPKGVPLRIFADPLSWMKANCEGVVPLKWPEAGRWLHLAGGPFICDDQLHAEEIYNLLYPFGDHHEIRFPKRARFAT